MTPKLKARLEWRANQGTGVDPMDCAQNRPTAVTFGRPKVTGWTATIVVHESFSAGGDHPISVTVDLRRLKLTEVGC